MPKRSRTKTKTTIKPKKTKSRRPKKDENQAAYDMLQKVIGETEGTGKNPLAVALGRLGGLKGGPARAEKLTPEERSTSARNAATWRWGKRAL